MRHDITVDLTIILVGVLLAATTGASIEYYRQIRKAQKEYEKARDFVEDIVLSFNRELKRESDRFESIAFKVDGSASKSESNQNKIENFEKKLAFLEEQLGSVGLSIQQLLTQDTQNNTSLLSSLEGLELKIQDIEASQETLRNKIIEVETQIQKIPTTPPEVKTEPLMPVIPIKRDKAMAALTDTEIAVLEMLSKEGAKTAPEIKERLQLSREHTARLMKKLYEEGYLEREAGKIPFRYSIKKEMETLMQKAESTST
ncbi:MAG: MarR family transcriptional regulator [Candidatus Bathyarchaeota archaeon]|nr:MarR family transcriptional regulator [Candidatus Bathyarchaeota archaeon]